MIDSQSGRLPARDPLTTARCVLLLAIALITAGSTYVAGRRLGMSTIVSDRHAYYSLPYAISHRYYGSRGHVILRDVAEFFINTHPHISDETLVQSTALTPAL